MSEAAIINTRVLGFSTQLAAAGKSRSEIQKRAEHYRKNQLPKRASNRQAIRKVILEAASA